MRKVLPVIFSLGILFPSLSFAQLAVTPVTPSTSVVDTEMNNRYTEIQNFVNTLLGDEDSNEVADKITFPDITTGTCGAGDYAIYREGSVVQTCVNGTESNIKDADTVSTKAVSTTAAINSIVATGAGSTIDDAWLSSTISKLEQTINSDEMAAEDFGSFTCSGAAQGCLLDANSVDSNEIATDAVGPLELDQVANYVVSGIWNFNINDGTFYVRDESVLPGTCSIGEIILNTTTDSLHVCIAANTWEDDDDTGTVGGTGDITSVGDCISGDCFTGTSGTTLTTSTDMIVELDSDGNGTNSFQIKDDAGTIVFEVDENGETSTLAVATPTVKFNDVDTVDIDIDAQIQVDATAVSTDNEDVDMTFSSVVNGGTDGSNGTPRVFLKFDADDTAPDALTQDVGTRLQLNAEQYQFGGLDCSGVGGGNGEYVTTDANGVLVCGNDDGGAGGTAFSSISTGVNTTATMTVDTGASMVISGSGAVNSTSAQMRVYNDSGVTLTKCTPVYISGFDGGTNLPEASIADSSLGAAAVNAIGLVSADISNLSSGFITTHGILDSVDTDNVETWAVGDYLYVNDSGTSATTDCGEALTNVRSTSFLEDVVPVARVTRVNATVGKVQVLKSSGPYNLPNAGEDFIFIGDTDEGTAGFVRKILPNGALSYNNTTDGFSIAGFNNMSTTNTSAELAGIITNETGTGVVVFGTGPTISFGADSTLSLDATLDTAGEFTFDQTRDQFIIHDGTSDIVFDKGSCDKAITVEDPTGSEDISFGFDNRAITITEVRGVILGATSVTIQIRHGTDRSAAGNALFSVGQVINSTTTGNDLTTFSDATVAADSFMWLETTALVGTPTELHLTACYTVDRI